MRFAIYELETSKTQEVLANSCKIVNLFINISEVHLCEFLNAFNVNVYLSLLNTKKIELKYPILTIFHKLSTLNDGKINFLSHEFVESILDCYMDSESNIRLKVFQMLSNFMIADNGRHFRYFNNPSILDALKFTIEKDSFLANIAEALSGLLIFLDLTSAEEFEQVVIECQLFETVYRPMKRLSNNVVIKSLDCFKHILLKAQLFMVENDSIILLESVKLSENYCNFTDLFSHEDESIKTYAKEIFSQFIESDDKKF